jgi:hypothetical protein
VPLRLRPLRDDEVPAFIEHGRAAYERDLVAQAGATSDGAATKAATDWTRLFPDGVVPPGIGREAMLLFEDEVRSRGLGKATLMVFGGNEVARSLYRSLGYAERVVFMWKTL